MSTNRDMTNELDLLFRKSMAVVEVIVSGVGSDDEIMIQLQKTLVETHKAKNLAGMRMIANDMFEWASGLPNKARSEINEKWLEISREC